MNKAEKALARYKSVIIADKSRALPKSILSVLERELRALFCNYFEVKSVSADLDYDADGNLWLTVESAVGGIKQSSPHTLPVLENAPPA